MIASGDQKAEVTESNEASREATGAVQCGADNGAAAPVFDSSDALTPVTEDPSQELALSASSAAIPGVEAPRPEAAEGDDARQPWNRRLWRVSFAAAMDDNQPDNDDNFTQQDRCHHQVHVEADPGPSHDDDDPPGSPSAVTHQGAMETNLESHTKRGGVSGDPSDDMNEAQLDSLDLAQERMTLAEQVERSPPSPCVADGGPADASDAFVPGSSRSYSARSASVNKGPKPEHRFI
jgi:hypothetical protein